MPSSNYTVPLCIIGEAELALITISGKYNAVVSAGITPSSEINTPYSGTGNLNDNSTLFTRTYSAAAGYYLTTPVASVVIGDQSNYNIINTPTYDIDGNLIATQFDFNYNYPNYSISGDEINVSIGTSLIYIPTQEISAYTLLTAPVANGGELRPLVLFGDAGAVFSVTVLDSSGFSYNVETNSVMGASGIFTTNIVFPEIPSGAIADETYTITISGDLAATFGPNPIVLTQYLINPTITITGTSALNITGFAPASESGIPLSTPSALSVNANWVLSETGGLALSYNGTLDTSDFEFTQPIGVDTTVASPGVTNSATVDVIDATGVLAGDKFNVDVQQGEAPFQHEVTAVSGNTLTVTPNITVVTGQILLVSRTNGNTIFSPTVIATQIDPQNVQFNMNVGIANFGNDDITFTLDLDKVMAITSSTTRFSLSAGYDVLVAQSSCCSLPSIYYTDSNNFATATEIWVASTGGSVAASGYYSTLAGSRYWDGSTLTALSACGSCYTQLSLCYTSVDATTLCCGISLPAIVYVAFGETFNSNTGIYSNPGLTSAAPDGWYSATGICALQP
jgi:hypothetical protein